MIGTELVWKRLKQSGRQIIVTTLTQSLGTFLLVTAVFGVIFYFMDIPLYLAAIFGGIALATAPAPGAFGGARIPNRRPRVTHTLIPMAALDDIVGVIVFFTVISVVGSNLSQTGTSPAGVVWSILAP